MAPVKTQVDVADKVTETEDVQPPLDNAITKLMAESECSLDEAVFAITWVQKVVEDARKYSDLTYHPNDSEMETRSYAVIDAVMPHGQRSKPGSAHQALETLVLDPSRGELALLHDQQGTVRRDCAVWIELETVDVS